MFERKKKKKIQSSGKLRGQETEQTDIHKWCSPKVIIQYQIQIYDG